MHYIIKSLIISFLITLPIISMLSSIVISLTQPTLYILWNPTIIFLNISINKYLISIVIAIILKAIKIFYNTKDNLDDISDRDSDNSISDNGRSMGDSDKDRYNTNINTNTNNININNITTTNNNITTTNIIIGLYNHYFNILIPFTLSFISSYLFIKKIPVSFILSILEIYKYNYNIEFISKKGLIPYLLNKNINANSIYILIRILPIIFISKNIIISIILTYTYIIIKEYIISIFVYNYYIFVIKYYNKKYNNTLQMDYNKKYNNTLQMDYNKKYNNTLQMDRIAYLHNMYYNNNNDMYNKYIYREIDNINRLIVNIKYIIEEYNNYRYIKIKIREEDSKPGIFKKYNNKEKERVRREKVFRVGIIYYYFKKEFKIKYIVDCLKRSMCMLNNINRSNRELNKEINGVREKIEMLKKYDIEII